MPEDPLHNWCERGLPGTGKPRLLRRLGHGRTNESYLLDIDGQCCVLRVNAGNSAALGIDRHREKLILEQAAAAGIAPGLLYCSVNQGVLITEYINGHHWQASALEDPDRLAMLMEGLQRIHALAITTTPFDYEQHARHYWQQLEARGIRIPAALTRQRDEIADWLTEIPETDVLCHHDPNPGNIIIQGNRLYFLDWEYAAPAWPLFDLAAVAKEWRVPLQRLSLPGGVNYQDLGRATQLYDYFCALWNCLNSGKCNSV